MLNDRTFKGFHQFDSSKPFEVFHSADCALTNLEKGFYWWACVPGNLPHDKPHGPYPTAEGAYLAAIGE